MKLCLRMVPPPPKENFCWGCYICIHKVYVRISRPRREERSGVFLLGGGGGGGLTSMFGLVYFHPCKAPTQMLVCCVRIRRRVFLYHGKKKRWTTPGGGGFFSQCTHRYPPSHRHFFLFIYLFIVYPKVFSPLRNSPFFQNWVLKNSKISGMFQFPPLFLFYF